MNVNKNFDWNTLQEVSPACCYNCQNCAEKANDYYWCNHHNVYLSDETDFVVGHCCDDFC